MNTKLSITLLLLPLACASEASFDVAEGTGLTTGGVDTSTAETGSETSDAGSTSSSTTGPGSETGSDTGSETGFETGSETGNGTGTADTGSTNDTGTAGETGGETGGAETGGGMQVFPGDDCDPFLDECLDQGGDYECQQNLRLDEENQPEIYFECTELNVDWGDGTYAAQCHIEPYEQCVTGFWCRSEGHFPANTCAGPACCIELCYFGQDCGGNECVVDIWQADLADYLVVYDGIGHCP